MADTIITVNADGTADFTSLTTAIESSGREIGEGNKLIFLCSGTNQEITSTISLSDSGYGETGELVIKGNTTTPYISNPSDFVLNVSTSIMIDSQNSCEVTLETLTIDSGSYTSFLSLIRASSSNTRFRGGEITGCRIIKNGTNSVTLFRSSQTSSGDWKGIITDSVVIGVCKVIVGSYATPLTVAITRSVITDCSFISNIAGSADAPQITDSAIRLTGDSYSEGGASPEFTNSATLDGVGTDSVTVSNWDALFEDAANDNYTLAGDSALLDAGSTGNNIGADQITEATLPIISISNPTPLDGEAVSFTVANMTGVITSATLSGIDILSELSSTDSQQSITFSLDFLTLAANAANSSVNLPLIGGNSTLRLETSGEVATLDLTYQPKAGWSYSVVDTADTSAGSLGESLQDDLGVTVETGDVIYYNTAGNTSVNSSLNYQSDYQDENDFTELLYQKQSSATAPSDSYAANFYPYQDDIISQPPIANAVPDLHIPTYIPYVTPGKWVKLDAGGVTRGIPIGGLNVKWAQTAGTPVKLIASDTLTPSFKAPVGAKQTLVFELEATNYRGAASTATINIPVDDNKYVQD